MIEVFIDKPIWADTLEFYIIDRNSFDNKRYLLRFGKYNVSMEELKEFAEKPEPTFTLSGKQGNEFLKVMAEKAAEQGIKLDSDLKREGKLEAIEKHLDDMRKLVFKTHDSNAE